MRYVRKAMLEILDSIHLYDKDILLALMRMAVGDQDGLVQVKAGATLEKLGASVGEMLEAIRLFSKEKI